MGDFSCFCCNEGFLLAIVFSRVHSSKKVNYYFNKFVIKVNGNKLCFNIRNTINISYDNFEFLDFFPGMVPPLKNKKIFNLRLSCQKKTARTFSVYVFRKILIN